MAVFFLLLISCSKNFDNQYNNETNNEPSARGLGSFGQFAGQDEGESFTTQAPHNQVYLFAYDSNVLKDKYIPSVNAQAEYLKSHPKARILLAGHTDERGSREYNIALGERRANTVAELMRLSGVSKTQIRVVSYGKERPVVFGHDSEAHQANRRVELTYEATR